MVSETRIDFAMNVQVRGVMPAAVLIMEEENHAFADVDEEADISAASVIIRKIIISILL